MRRGVYNKFNRGELDSSALMRDDVEKVNNSCALMDNWVPQRLGPMMYRPGTIMVSPVDDNVHNIPFIARTDNSAIVQVGTDVIKVWVDEQVVIKPQGTLTLTNENFTTDLVGWTDASDIGSTVLWNNGAADLNGTKNTSAKMWQTFGGSVTGVDTSVLIVITGAPMEVRIGESGFNSFDIFKGTLEPGTHQLVINPVAALPTITFINSNPFEGLLRQCVVGDDTELELPTPASIVELASTRYAQSADVIFFATSSTPQFKIERRGNLSWGVADFRMDDGPFGLINNTDVTLKTNNLDRNALITASDDFFTPEHVGRLLKLTSAEQRVREIVTGDDFGTGSIRVTGVDSPVRRFLINITGVWDGTVTLQRSTDDLSWQDVETYGKNKSKWYNDKLDNAILYYRLWVVTGEFTSGTITMSLVYENGSKDGVARIVSYESPTSVRAQTLKSFGSFEPTKDWHVSEWGEDGSFPSAVALYEGRLWWAGLNKLWGSVSDEYSSFDDDLEGDSAPIRRTIGFGPVDRVEWIGPSSRLILGLASDEITVRSSSFGEVLSQSNCNLKSGSTQGVAPIEPVKIDDSLLFVHRSGVKIMDAAYTTDTDNHSNTDMMTLHPTVCKEGIVRVAVSRQPETRTYIVMEDGTMRIHLQDPAEDVIAWSRYSTEGLVKDVVVLPGLVEDRVYLWVERDGTLYMERMSRIADMVEQHYDGAVLYQNASGTLHGLDHLENRSVMAWGDGGLIEGPILKLFLVAGGSITLPAGTWGKVTVGIPYVADYQSNKISQYLPRSRVMGRLKRVVDLHLAMEDLWPGAVNLGPTFDLLEIMPEIEYGKPLDMTKMIKEYDEHPFEFNGNDDIDPRICVRAVGPAVILAMSYGVLTQGEGDE